MKEIAEKLETEEECVRKKMKSLQSYYCQLRRRKYEEQSTTVGGSFRKPSWPFYDMLEFLDISSLNNFIAGPKVRPPLATNYWRGGIASA